MIELLALPSHDAPPIGLDAWALAFLELGHPATIVPEGSGVAWIEVGPLRLRGYVVLSGATVEAINFEVHDASESESRTLVETAARRLGWEVDEDEDEQEDDLEE